MTSGSPGGLRFPWPGASSALRPGASIVLSDTEVTKGATDNGSSDDTDGIVDERTVGSPEVAEPDPAAGSACKVLSDSVIVPSLSSIVTTSTATQLKAAADNLSKIGCSPAP